jgi:hypothetical protein
MRLLRDYLCFQLLVCRSIVNHLYQEYAQVPIGPPLWSISHADPLLALWLYYLQE